MNPHESEVLGAILRTHYASFLEKCFTTLNPATPFERNWHIDVLASRLQDVADGTTTRLIVNLPPRSLKSIATSVGLVAFYLGHHPSADVICASYGMDLAAKFAFDTRRIMTSPWYQAIFPTRIDPKKSAANNFYTLQGGSRLAGSVTSGITGRGADLVVIDDPAKPDEMWSDGVRETVNEWFRSTVYSRLNNKADARVVLAMQRLHVDDLTGHLLREGGEPWTLLKLAAKADTDETYVYRTPGGLTTYSRKAGELLHAARESEETLAQTRAALGNYFYAAQYQQDPVLPDGNLINLKWFPRYAEPPKKFDFVFQSWDTASKAGELNSFSVGTTWGVRGKAIYLLDVYRKKVEFPDLKRAVIEQARLHRPRVILVEEQSSGIALLQELRRDGLYTLKAVKPDKDKTMRMRAQTALIENGQVWLPERAAWLPAYEMELMLFPEVPHKDQADSTSQALGYWQERLQEPGGIAFYRMECERMGLVPRRLEGR
jgi:predicted phage terminase large subunit-like protein